MGFLRKCLAVFLGVLAALAPGAARAEPALHASPALTLDDLVRAVRRRSAALQEAQLDVELADAAVQQSRLLGNPELDLGWGTIPLGKPNPPDLPSPMRNIPNYTVGLSYTFLVGKRAPRRRLAEAQKEAAQASYGVASLEQALGLARAVGRLATVKLRQEGQKGLSEQGKDSLALAKIRLEAGQGTALDVDRLEVELGRIEQQALGAEGDERAALAACAALAGGECVPFESGAEARQFLQQWLDRASRLEGDVEQRPDIAAIEAQRRSAEQEGALARAAGKPDFTLRFGYTYDTFLVSGNQLHSLALQLSFPLPIFDRGQAQLAAASARQSRLAAVRDRVVAAERARIEPLRRALQTQRQRQEAISGKLLPRARAALLDLERASNNRLLPVTEVIQSRRTIQELLLEEADSFDDALQVALDLFAALPPPGALSPRSP
jgi:cobalt-zinc-cadmium efflux system outer membrane protein